MKFLFIDTETSSAELTGALLQVSGCLDFDGKVVESFDFKLKPYGDEIFDQGAIDKNGITKEIASSFENPSEVFVKFMHILNKAVDKFDKNDKLFFVGYNSKFDENFIRKWFIREATSEKDKKYGNGFGSYFWTPSIDVMQLAALRLIKYRSHLPNFKLGTVCNSLKIEFKEEDAHDALYDIKKTRELYYKLR